MDEKTLIVFAREPVEGKVKTRLSRSMGRAAATRVYSALLADTAQELSRDFAGKVVWHVDGDAAALLPLIGADAKTRPQSGGDLGERMKAAFAVEFAEGKGAVGIVGTDCPQLGGEALEKLFDALTEGCDAALLPAEDGGFAALALSRQLDGIFDGVRWSTNETLTDTLENFRRLGIDCRVLDRVRDIDEEADLAAYAKLAAGGGVNLGPKLSALLEKYGWNGPCPKTVVDDLGGVVILSPTPKRIVSLIPSVTEALFDLGLGGLVVGRTDFCISPADLVENLPSVGGPKTFAPEAVLALRPDLVIADAEENDKARVEALMAGGVRVFTALPRTLGDVSAFLRRIARLCGAENAAEPFAAKLDALTPPARKRSCVCLIWNDPPMIAAPGTLTASILAAAGFECLAPEGNRLPYPAVNLSALAALDPEAALLPSEPWPFTAAEAGTLKEILACGTIFLFPGEWATWYGAKTIENIENLSKLTEAEGNRGVVTPLA